MLSDEMVVAVQADLAVGRFSIRQIAKRNAVSRDFVTSIANGARFPGQLAKTSEQKEKTLRKKITIVPKHKCPECGHKVIFEPCQICIALAAKEKRLKNLPSEN